MRNTDRSPKSYTLSHIPAGTAITITEGDIYPATGAVPLTTDYATVKFSSTKFTLAPGQSKKVTVTIVPPAGVNKETYPVFSGFLEIASGSESVHVSYLGLAASLKDKQVLDNSDTIFGVKIPAILDSTGDVQANATNYTFSGDNFPTLLT